MPGQTIKVSSRKFYDRIAKEYDTKLSVAKDQMVRDEIMREFLSNVSDGNILDFGGGTGLDLPWLIEHKFQVVFCEPSENMRAIAKKNYGSSGGVTFLSNTDSDFGSWKKNLVETKFDAVLANFGVVNYIENLPLLFETFAKQTNLDGQLFLSLLNLSNKSLFKKMPKRFLLSLVSSSSIKVGRQFEGVRHESILYKPNLVVNAAKPYFDLVNKKRLGHSSDFVLLHFKKK